MQALDTSVVARWLLGDDPEQAELAADQLSKPTWISHTVLLELGWVLFKALGLPRETVADMLVQVTSVETVLIADAEKIDWAIQRFRQGADLADMIHLATISHHADNFATFDRKLAQKAGAKSPVAIVTLLPG